MAIDSAVPQWNAYIVLGMLNPEMSGSLTCVGYASYGKQCCRPISKANHVAARSLARTLPTIAAAKDELKLQQTLMDLAVCTLCPGYHGHQASDTASHWHRIIDAHMAKIETLPVPLPTRRDSCLSEHRVELPQTSPAQPSLDLSSTLEEARGQLDQELKAQYRKRDEALTEQETLLAEQHDAQSKREIALQQREAALLTDQEEATARHAFAAESLANATRDAQAALRVREEALRTSEAALQESLAIVHATQEANSHMTAWLHEQQEVIRLREAEYLLRQQQDARARALKKSSRRSCMGWLENSLRLWRFRDADSEDDEARRMISVKSADEHYVHVKSEAEHAVEQDEPVETETQTELTGHALDHDALLATTL